MIRVPPTANDRKAPVIRRAMRLANANAALWAVGNGLVSTQLVVYLASEFGARGLWISLILAAPRIVGLLRLAAPAVIARTKNRKAVCINAYLASAVILTGVPRLAQSDRLFAAGVGMAALVATWSVYHLCEFVGTVTLWSWLGDLTPRRIRGRLLGQRKRWLIVGRVIGTLASAAIATIWKRQLPDSPIWQPLALSAALGALAMFAAAGPLIAMPSVSRSPSAVPRLPWRSLAAALVDRRYRRLLAFACWFALVSGITLAAQQKYPIDVLKIPYEGYLLLSGLMWLGQIARCARAGRLADRFGNRPVMIGSQLVAASGLVFFLIATREHRWLIAGAYLAWIAYAGLNVGLDNIKLKLSPPDNNAPYLAVYYAIGDLANGLAIIAGGLFYDRLAAGGTDALSLYAQLFFWGWVGRTTTVFLLARLIEPNAKRLVPA